jgi:hypothetical protein
MTPNGRIIVNDGLETTRKDVFYCRQATIAAIDKKDWAKRHKTWVRTLDLWAETSTKPVVKSAQWPGVLNVTSVCETFIQHLGREKIQNHATVAEHLTRFDSQSDYLSAWKRDLSFYYTSGRTLYPCDLLAFAHCPTNQRKENYWRCTYGKRDLWKVEETVEEALRCAVQCVDLRQHSSAVACTCYVYTV